MPLFFEQKIKKQRLLLFGFFVLVLIGAMVGYREFFEGWEGIKLQPSKLFKQESEEIVFEKLPVSLEQLSNIKLESGIFDDTRFTSLEKNGIFPIVVTNDELGRENPFLPLGF